MRQLRNLLAGAALRRGERGVTRTAVAATPGSPIRGLKAAIPTSFWLPVCSAKSAGIYLTGVGGR